MKNIFIALALVASLFGTSIDTTAQEPLSIAESVTAGNGTLATENIRDLKWVPMSHIYSYRQGQGAEAAVMLGYADGRETKELMTAEELSDAFFNAGFVRPDDIPPFDWIDQDFMLFSFKGQRWTYHLPTKSVKRHISGTHVMGNVKVSPDFAKTAGTFGDNLFISLTETDSLRITDNSLPGIVSGQAVSRYEFGISEGIFWGPLSKRLAYYHKDESAVTEYGFMDYGPIPAVGVPAKYPMAGQASEHVEVRVYDIETKETTTLKVKGAHDDYITSVTWTLDGKEIILGQLDRAQDNFQLVSYSAKTGEQNGVLFTESDERYVEPEQGPYMLEGSKRGDFLWFSERDGYNHIYHYDGRGKLIKQVTSGERVMHSILNYNLYNKSIYVSGTDSPLETVVYKVSLDDGAMTRLTKEPGTHRASFTHDGKYFINRHRSTTVPRDITLRSQDGEIIKTLLSAPDATAGRKMGITDIYSIPAEDGTDLYCRMIKPSDFDPKKKYPVFVYVYNGPHVQLVKNNWLGGARLWMHHLAEKGYIVFTLDGRGSLNRGRDFEQAVHAKLGTQETEDQMAGVAHLRSLPYVDSDRMAVHGWSFGGFMTLNLMLREPGTFKLGIAGGAVTDWRLYEVMYTERYMETPEANPDGFSNSSLSGLADQLEGDLLMIHGSSDDVVVPQHFMVMLNAFINADKQVDMFIYPGHKHNVYGPDRVHLITQIVEYIESRL